MKLNVGFLALTFIVVIVVILLSKDTLTAIMIVTLIANFVMISINLSNTAAKPTGENLWSEPVEPTPRIAPEEPDIPHIYGPEYDIYQNNKTTYDTAYGAPQFALDRGITEAFRGVDAANAYMAQARTRDKKCMDGAVSKTSDYYRHHYSNEFELEESKRWWGNNEI